MSSSDEERTRESAGAGEASLRLGSVIGVPIHADTRLLGLIALGVVFLSVRDAALGPALHLAFTLLLVLASVLVHEFGHALCARRLGVPVRDIRIHAFFGVTRMEAPRNAREEILIALAGPLASLSAALLLTPVWLLARSGFLPEAVIWPLQVLALANALLGCLNLVPAFPMDGGRVLRGLLRPRLGLLAATRLAVWIGRVLAVAMVATPLWYRPLSMAIGVAVVGIVVLSLGEAEWRRTRRLAD